MARKRLILPLPCVYDVFFGHFRGYFWAFLEKSDLLLQKVALDR
jgi:hypothetical protein